MFNVRTPPSDIHHSRSPPATVQEHSSQPSSIALLQMLASSAGVQLCSVCVVYGGCDLHTWRDVGGGRVVCGGGGVVYCCTFVFTSLFHAPLFVAIAYCKEEG